VPSGSKLRQQQKVQQMQQAQMAQMAQMAQRPQGQSLQDGAPVTDNFEPTKETA
jgi:hypothetical protein